METWQRLARVRRSGPRGPAAVVRVWYLDPVRGGVRPGRRRFVQRLRRPGLGPGPDGGLGPAPAGRNT